MNRQKPSGPRFTAAELTYTAIAAALIAVCSWISIPAAVPFTMQTFGVFFALSLLGGKCGTLAVLVYVLLGAAGLPVFAGFSSGAGVLLGSTGGYILGFLLSGLAYGLTVKALGKNTLAEILGMTAGLIFCYASGTAWFMLVYARDNGPVGLGMVLSWCVVPFILPDLAKMALAIYLAARIRPALKG